MLLVHIGGFNLLQNTFKSIKFSAKLVCKSLQQCGYLYSQLHVSSQCGVAPPQDDPLLVGQAVQQLPMGLHGQQPFPYEKFLIQQAAAIQVRIYSGAPKPSLPSLSG